METVAPETVVLNTVTFATMILQLPLAPSAVTADTTLQRVAMMEITLVAMGAARPVLLSLAGNALIN